MRIDDIELRMSQIKDELTKEGADLNALKAEAEKLKEERAAIRAEAEKAEELRKKIAEGDGTTVSNHESEGKKMTNLEIRNSEKYLVAFGNYIKTGDDRECRALLTENVNGTVPVPEMVEATVNTAWEKNEILSRVRKTNIRGNLKIPFEQSATDAVEHIEGTDAPDEEDLKTGIVEMIPKNVKKWIRLSDETIALAGAAFLNWVYTELTYKIVRELARLVIADIVALPVASTDTTVGAAKVTGAPSVTIVPDAFAYLSDEANECVVIMNKLTYKEFVAARAAGNFAVDPFDGMKVLYSSALPAYSAASSGAVYAIVGDLYAAHVNYPEGEGVRTTYDDKSESEKDLVKLVGRQYAAHAVDAPFRFTRIVK